MKKVIRDLRERNVPLDKVIIRMQMVKDLADYANKGPHVAAAQRMQNQGINVASGTIIEYVVVAGSEMISKRVRLPNEVQNNEYDAEYYIEHQVIPAVERIFDVLGYPKEALSGSHKQKSLSGFF